MSISGKRVITAIGYTPHKSAEEIIEEGIASVKAGVTGSIADQFLFKEKEDDDTYVEVTITIEVKSMIPATIPDK